MNNSMSPSKVLYGIAYGGIVAGVYLLARVLGQKGGLDLFTLSAVVIFLGHLIILPRRTLLGFTDWKMCVRGVLFGLTQVLIFKAQAAGQTSAALVASTMGSVCGVLLGRAFLKEQLQGLGVFAAFCCFGAAFASPKLILVSYWGVLGGLIQGAGFVLARSLMVERKGAAESISTGFALGALIGLIALWSTGDLSTLAKVDPMNIVIVVTIALLIQYAFFYLYKILDAQRASMLLLSRIPWAIGLEHVLLGAAVLAEQLFSSALIALSAALLLFEGKFKRESLSTRISHN